MIRKYTRNIARWAFAGAVLASGQQAATVMAQEPPGGCGTVVTDEVIAAELDRQAAGLFDAAPELGVDDYKYIRLAIHIVRRSDGTGGVDKLDIQTGLNTANNHFAASRMVLVPLYQDYIDSDVYYDLLESEGDSLRQESVVAGMLNIYFVGDAPYCGQATFPAGTPGGGGPQGIIMNNDCAASGGVLSHEIGHYFLLYHTHETALGADCPGAANCGGLGDLVCDTPPDPGLHNCDGSLGSCVDDCEYTGSATCGGQPYSPSVANTMSYTDPDCMTGFTVGQRTRIAYSLTLSDRADEILFEHPCGNAAFAAPISVGSFGNWVAPASGIRLGVALAAAPCPATGGVVIARRGLYFAGPGVFNTPVTIVASGEGPGQVVEIRP